MEWDFENDGIVDQTTEPFSGAFSSIFESSGVFTTIVVAKTESGNSVQRSVRATVGLGSTDLVVFVRDEIGEPLSDAQVNLDEISLAWNGAPDNYYLLTGMPPDEYDLEIAANGYITHYEKTSLLDGSNSKEFFLNPADGGSTSNPHICNVKIGVPKGTRLGNNKWVESPVFLSGACTGVSSSSIGSFEALFMPEVNWNSTIPGVVRVHHPIDDQIDCDWNDVKASGLTIDVARLSPGQTVGFQAISEGNELSARSSWIGGWNGLSKTVRPNGWISRWTGPRSTRRWFSKSKSIWKTETGTC